MGVVDDLLPFGEHGAQLFGGVGGELHVERPESRAEHWMGPPHFKDVLPDESVGLAGGRHARGVQIVPDPVQPVPVCRRGQEGEEVQARQGRGGPGDPSHSGAEPSQPLPVPAPIQEDRPRRQADRTGQKSRSGLREKERDRARSDEGEPQDPRGPAPRAEQLRPEDGKGGHEVRRQEYGVAERREDPVHLRDDHRARSPGPLQDAVDRDEGEPGHPPAQDGALEIGGPRTGTGLRRRKIRAHGEDHPLEFARSHGGIPGEETVERGQEDVGEEIGIEGSAVEDPFLPGGERRGPRQARGDQSYAQGHELQAVELFVGE